MPLLQFKVQSNYDEVVRLRREIESLEDTLRNFGPGTAESTIRNLENQLVSARAQFNALADDAIRCGAAVERSLRESMDRMRQPKDVTVNVKANTQPFHFSMLETDKDFKNLMNNLDSYSRQLKGFFTSVSSLAGFTLPMMGILDFLGRVKETRSYFQDIESTMNVLLGSEEKSLQFCEQLKDAAYWNMFEYADLVDASKQMIAYGVATDQIIPKINQLSEVATATKGSLGEMVFMYNRAKAIGYVDSRALQTWASHGLVVKDVLQEMGEKAYSSKITFDQLNKVLDHVTGAGGMFHNVMKGQMSNISAEIGQLEDNMSLMFNDIGETMQEPLRQVIYWAGQIVDHWKEVGVTLGLVGVAAGGIKLGNIVAEKGKELTLKDFNDELDATNEKLQELSRTAAEVKLDDDIQNALNAGHIKKEDAVKYQTTRNQLRDAKADNKTLEQLKQEAAQRLAVADAMEVERQKLAELNKEYAANKPEKVTLDDDLSREVDAGTTTRDKAEELQKARNEMAELAKERQKAAEAAGSEAAEYQGLADIYKKDLEVAQERKAQADQMVESIQQQVELENEKGGNGEELAESLGLEAALREQVVAQTEVETVQEEYNTATELANSASSRQAALSNEAQAISSRAAAAAETTDTAATQANSVATNANSVATAKNTLLTKLGAAANKTGATMMLMMKNAVNSVKNSFNALKAAIISNPIGLLITAISTAIGLFMAFRKETDETSAEVETFGESAIKTKNKVELLYSILANTKEGSKTWRDALAELEKQAKDYGLVLDKENDKYGKLIELRERLIALIKEEGRQRLVANNIQSLYNDKEEAVSTFRTDFSSIIEKGTNQTTDMVAQKLKMASNFIITSWINALADENTMSELNTLFARLDDFNSRATLSNAERLQYKQDYQRVLNILNGAVKPYLAEQGINIDTAFDNYSAIQKFREMLSVVDEIDTQVELLTETRQRSAEELASLRFNPNENYAAMGLKDLTQKLVDAADAAKNLSEKTIAPPTDPVNIHNLFEEGLRAQNRLEQVGNQTITPNTDNTRLDETEQRAGDVESALHDVDNTVATPYIDTKYLDIANNTLGNIRLTLQEVGGQILHTTAAEREALQRIKRNHGGTYNGMTEAEQAERDRIYANARRRSFLRLNNGKRYHLNAEQSAVLQQLMDSDAATTADGKISLAENQMSENDRRLFRQLKYDLLLADYNQQRNDVDASIQNMKADYERRLNEANSTDDFNNIRSEIQSAQRTVDQTSQLYRYFENFLQRLNNKDRTKNGNPIQLAQRAYEIARSEMEERKRQDELTLKAEQEKREMEIAAMDEGTEKEIATIHFNAEKRRKALLAERDKEVEKLKDFDRKQWVQGGTNRQAYQWQQTVSDDEYKQRAAENIGYDDTLANIAYKESTDLEKAYNNEITSMRDYLKEYGTFNQRKLAIAQEYSRKIAEAETEGERLSLKAQERQSLDEIEGEAIAAKIDWYSVFDNVGLVMKGQLEPLLQQLQAYVKTDAFRQSGADNQKAVVEAMKNLRQQLGTGSTSWRDLAASLSDYQEALNELRKATEENTRLTTQQGVLMQAEQTAKDNLEQAQSNLANGTGTQEQVDAAQTAYEQAAQAVVDFGETMGLSATAVQNAQNRVTTAGSLLQQTATNVAHPISGITTFLQNSAIPQLGELFAAFDELRGSVDVLKGISNLKKNAEDLKEGADKLNQEGVDGIKNGVQKLGEKIGSDVPKTLIDGLDTAGAIGQFISAVLSILNILKDGIGTLISNIIDTVLESITGILDNILSGEFAIQISHSLVKGLGGIFKSITTLGGLFDWWGNGESDPDLEEDVERLTLTNEALCKAIEDLTDEMRDSSIKDIELKYQQIIDNLNQSIANTQEMMQREGAAYSNGFLGIGGHKSSNTKINDNMTAADWKRISGFVGQTVKSASDFWKLSSAQMLEVKKNAADLYAKIKQYADDGYKDASQYMDEYIEYAEEIEEIERQRVEALTNISLDSVKDEFKSLLGNMESTAEDFADNFENMMRQAVINAFVNEIFDSAIETWYKHFTEAMSSDEQLTAAEQTQLETEWENMVNAAIKQRDELAKAMGWDISTTQQTSTRSIAAMSQDTGDAIEGRLTALQIAVEAIRGSEQEQAVSLAQITEDVFAILTRNNAMNQHYENIEQQIANCYMELVSINENTEAIVKPIKDMRGFLNEMNQKL